MFILKTWKMKILLIVQQFLIPPKFCTDSATLELLMQYTITLKLSEKHVNYRPISVCLLQIMLITKQH